MIKIDTANLPATESLYFEHLKNHLMSRKIGKSSVWQLLQTWVAKESNNLLSVDDLFRIKFDDLFTICELLYRNKYPDCVLYLKKSYKTLTNAGFRIKGASSFTAYQLVSAIGVQVCPYCNRNFINNVANSNRRTSQLDHFYDKDTFPFLAVSFYNLVPSCGPCNHLKGNKSIEISPYSSAMSDTHLVFDYQGDIYTPNSLQFQYIVKEEMESNLEVFRLKDVYNIHLDYLREVLMKKKIFPQSQIQEYLNKYPDLFRTEEEVKQIIFANYIDENDFGKRPLSKLTNDIIKSKKE